MAADEVPFTAVLAMLSSQHERVQQECHYLAAENLLLRQQLVTVSNGGLWEGADVTIPSTPTARRFLAQPHLADALQQERSSASFALQLPSPPSLPEARPASVSEHTAPEPDASKCAANKMSARGVQSLSEQMDHTTSAILLRWSELTAKFMEYSESLKYLASKHAPPPELELEPVWSLSKAYTQTKLRNLHMARASIHPTERKRRLSSKIAARAGDEVLDAGACGLCLWLHLRPDAPTRIAWNITGGLFILYDMLTLPLLVFQFTEFIENALYVVTVITMVYWVFDVPLNFFTGYHTAGRVEMRMRMIGRRYMSTWFFPDVFIVFIDLSSTFLLTDAEEAEAAISDQGQIGAGLQKLGSYSRFLRMVRMVRFIRVVKLMEMLTVVNDMFFQSSGATLRATLFKQVLVIFLFNHYVGCFWYFITQIPSQYFDSGETWLQVWQMDTEDATTQYLASLHWSITQIAPGTQDICPVNPIERFYALLVVLAALVLFAAFLSRITSVLTQLQAMNHEHKRNEAMLRDFLGTRRVKLNLRDRIWRFFRQHSRHRRIMLIESSIEFLRLAPESTLIELHKELYYKALMTNRVFNLLSHIEGVLFEKVCHAAMTESLWMTSQDVFVSGNTAETVYVVSSGRLSYLTVLDNYMCHELEENAWIAELTLWIKWLHCGQFVAETPTCLVELVKTDFQDLIHSWGGPLCECLKRYAVFLLGYMEQTMDAGKVVTDISMDGDELEGLALRALRLNMLGVNKKGAERRNLFSSWGARMVGKEDQPLTLQ